MRAMSSVMNSTSLAKISQSYENHPLSAQTIRARLRRSGRIEELTEVDLAIDDVTFLTDQNHTAGMSSVVTMARSVGIQGGEQILDIGTGLGGTPRVLAHFFGCRCHGVELTASRYRDANELTRLVGLDKLVTFSWGDFLREEVPYGPFDLVIAQDTLMHFPDLEPVLEKCSTLLCGQGQLVIDDGFLRRSPATNKERQQTTAAWEQWNGRFKSVAHWQQALQKSGFEIITTEDWTAIALHEYDQRLERASWANPPIDAQERSGWRLGSELIREGIIGVMRLICQHR